MLPQRLQSLNPPLFFSRSANLISKVSLRVSLLNIISTHLSRTARCIQAESVYVSSKLHYSQLNNAPRRCTRSTDGNLSISQCQHAPHVANQSRGPCWPAPVIGKLLCAGLSLSRRNYNLSISARCIRWWL